MSELFRFGEQAREFLKGLLQVGSASPPSSSPQAGDIIFLFARNRGKKTVLTFSWDSSSDDNYLVLSTIHPKPSGGLMPVQLRIPRSEVDLLSLKSLDQEKNEYTLVSRNETANINITIEQTVGPSEKEITYYGTYTDYNQNSTIEFVAVTDPVPVLVVAAAIGAVTCMIMTGIQAIVTDCDEFCSSGCGEKGVKRCVAQVTLGVSYNRADGFTLGCGKACVKECN